MTTGYVAGFFPAVAQAQAARESLLDSAAQGAVRVFGAWVLVRGEDGNVKPLTPSDDSDWFADGADGEATDEVNERLPDGFSALLAHVTESDPSVADGIVRTNGGTLFRRSLDEINASSTERFFDATSM